MSDVLQTERLHLREAVVDDAAFILELHSDPDWQRFIGDRGVSDLATAVTYIEDKLQASYRDTGFGMYVVALKDGTPLGLCGLVRREGLPEEDIGFAFLPAGRGQGYAREAAAAILAWSDRQLGLPRLAAITLPENSASISLLEALGFEDRGTVNLPGDDARLNYLIKEF